MKRRDAGWFVACVAFLSGCGSAASWDHVLPSHPAGEGDTTDTSAALLTIRAYFEEPLPADIVRKYALVWFPESPGKGAIQVADNATARELGGILSIDIAGGPPETAPRTVAYDRAELVVYHDGNYGNGRLDISADSPDRILARAAGVYFRVAPPAGNAVANGSDAKSANAGEGTSAVGSRFLASASEDDTRCGDGPESNGQWNRPRICIRTTPGSMTTDVSEKAPIWISPSEKDLPLRSYLCPGFWGTSGDRPGGWAEDACLAHN